MPDVPALKGDGAAATPGNESGVLLTCVLDTNPDSTNLCTLDYHFCAHGAPHAQGAGCV